MTKKVNIKLVMDGAAGEYSHLIMYSDRWHYTYGYRYVKNNENINMIINDINFGENSEIFLITEIYNYHLDLKKQLNEKRSYHIEPITKHNQETQHQKTQSQTSNEQNIYNNKDFKKAVEYAIKMHKNQYRLDGSPYIKHPLGVVKNILKYKKPKNLEILLISAILHDVIEDTSASYYDIVNLFGPQIASIVLELTTDEDLKREIGKTRYLEIKMKNMSSWALTIKLCDRLDNICDLNGCNIEFKNRCIKETIEIIYYLLKNRKLNKTQINIINKIVDKLLSISNIKENDKLSEIKNRINEIYKKEKECV